MIPLAEQIRDGWLILGLLLYLPFALWPVIALAQSRDRWRIGWTIAAAALGVGVSVWHFTETPPGVSPDVGVTMDVMSRDHPWLWLWLEQRTVSGQGWTALPWYLLNRGTGTYLGERVIGLCWYGVLVMAVGAVAPRRGVPVALAFLCTPTAWWLSRHALGTEILVQQVTLIAVLNRLRRGGSAGATLAAGACAGALTYTYAAARIVLLYPAMWLWRAPGRMCLVYLLCAFMMLPMWAVAMYTRQPLPLRLVPGHIDLWDPLTIAKVTQSVGSLWDADYAQWGTWCYQGAQTLPKTAWLGVVAGGALGGWRYLPAAALGLVPDLVAPVGGKSHRQMMLFMPLAFAAAFGLGRVPLGVVVIGAGAIAAEGAWIWLGDEFWARGRKYYMYLSGLFPCATETRPAWCGGL